LRLQNVTSDVTKVRMVFFISLYFTQLKVTATAEFPVVGFILEGRRVKGEFTVGGSVK